MSHALCTLAGGQRAHPWLPWACSHARVEEWHRPAGCPSQICLEPSVLKRVKPLGRHPQPELKGPLCPPPSQPRTPPGRLPPRQSHAWHAHAAARLKSWAFDGPRQRFSAFFHVWTATKFRREARPPLEILAIVRGPPGLHGPQVENHCSRQTLAGHPASLGSRKLERPAASWLQPQELALSLGRTNPPPAKPLPIQTAARPLGSQGRGLHFV